MNHFNLLGSLPNEEENLNEARALFEPVSHFMKTSLLLSHGVPASLAPTARKARDNMLDLLKQLDVTKRQHVAEITRKITELDRDKGDLCAAKCQKS